MHVCRMSATCSPNSPPSSVSRSPPRTQQAIELKDKFENIGASLVKQVASATNDVAGDGEGRRSTGGGGGGGVVGWWVGGGSVEWWWVGWGGRRGGAGAPPEVGSGMGERRR